MEIKYKLKFSKSAQKDAILLHQAGLKSKTEKLLSDIQKQPSCPPAKKLVGNLDGKYSRRINIQHRIVYEVLDDKIIKILRIWSHYE